MLPSQIPTKMIPNNYSDKTLFGIQDNRLQYSWIAYYLFVILSSAIGDTAILVATTDIRTFRLHSFIIVIIQHIAVCDLLVTIISALPRLISLFADEWVFGEVLCKVLPDISQCLSVSGMLLICALIISKLIILSYPTRARRLTISKAHKICTIIWLSSLTVPINYIIVKKGTKTFDYRIYTCYLTTIDRQWLLMCFITVFLFAPPILVIAASMPLVRHLLKARASSVRAGGAIRWRGITTTILVALTYCVSVVPYGVYRFAESFINYNESVYSRIFHDQYYRAASSLFFINTISNFYIYCCTVPSFRSFIVSRIKLLAFCGQSKGKNIKKKILTF